MIKSQRWRLFFSIVVVLSLLVLVVWAINKQKLGRSQEVSNEPVGSPSPPPATATPTVVPQSQPPTVQPSPQLTPSDSPTPPVAEPTTDPTDPVPGFVGQLKLIVPVLGVREDQLIDTFDEARSEGRVHDAIDIPAPAGTPVVAAADGQIIKLFPSEKGGTTIYQLSKDRKLVFYYAHLQRYADGLAEGQVVRQGDVIGFVGDTGNAGPGNYHLHFSIAVVADPNRYWEGVNINPYPLLKRH